MIRTPSDSFSMPGQSLKAMQAGVMCPLGLPLFTHPSSLTLQPSVNDRLGMFRFVHSFSNPFVQEVSR